MGRFAVKFIAYLPVVRLGMANAKGLANPQLVRGGKLVLLAQYTQNFRDDGPTGTEGAEQDVF